MTKLVQDAMTPGVQTVRPSNSAAEAARFMRDNDVGALPVLGDDSKPIGMVTDRDLTMRIVADGKDPNTTCVEVVFSRDPVTIEAGRTLDEARKLMAEHKVRRLPVVAGGRLVGLLAQADIALAQEAEKAGKLVDELSERTSAARR